MVYYTRRFESPIHNISETPYEMGQYILFFRVEVMTFVVFPQWGVVVTVHHYSGVYYRSLVIKKQPTNQPRLDDVLFIIEFPQMYLLTCYHRLPEKSIKPGDIVTMKYYSLIIVNIKSTEKGIIYSQFFLKNE